MKKKSIVALALAGGLIAGPALAMPAFAEDAPAEPVKLDSVQAGVTHEGTPLERAEKILEEANAIVAELDAKRATLNEWQGKAEEALTKAETELTAAQAKLDVYKAQVAGMPDSPQKQQAQPVLTQAQETLDKAKRGLAQAKEMREVALRGKQQSESALERAAELLEQAKKAQEDAKKAQAEANKPAADTAILQAWRAQGSEFGVWGHKRSEEMPAPKYEGAVTQQFQNGVAYWANDAAGVRWLGTGINAEWQRLGGAGGALGKPTGNETDLGGGVMIQTFEHGRIYYTPKTGSRAIHGAILTGFINGGGHGVFGVPVGGEYEVADGVAQNFQRAVLTWTRQ